MDSSSVRAQVGRERCNADADGAFRSAWPAYVHAVLDEPCGTGDFVPSVHALVATRYFVFSARVLGFGLDGSGETFRFS